MIFLYGNIINLQGDGAQVWGGKVPRPYVTKTHYVVFLIFVLFLRHASYVALNSPSFYLSSLRAGKASRCQQVFTASIPNNLNTQPYE